MEFSFLHILKANLDKHSARNAFFIGGRYHTYAEFGLRIRQIYRLLLSVVTSRQNCIGVLTEDNLETYAAIMAIWYSGNIFVPLNPAVPVSRNREITGMSGLKTLLYSGTETPAAFESEGIACHSLRNLPEPEKELPDVPVSEPEIRYLLFTSGSTGVPKGVPISALNLDSFLRAFFSSGYEFSEQDRFLHIYDFSFDASVRSYCVPLTQGACIYTVPPGSVKFLEAIRLMRDYKLTFIAMPPSTLSYLKPYFHEIRLEHVRYCLFGGEALNHNLVKEWAPCVPNALIRNVYGPTEATIHCTILDWKPDLDPSKIFNGLVSIGRPFGENMALVCNPDGQALPEGVQGELCLSGPQITPGYWNDPMKNQQAFFDTKVRGTKHRFYRTGDMVIRDTEGDLIYCGRIDDQIQVQGYRVELSEIEVHARKNLAGAQVAAVPMEVAGKPTLVHLFVENCPERIRGLKKYLSENLPHYMIPAGITSIEHFPLSPGGKIDRLALIKMIPEP